MSFPTAITDSINAWRGADIKLLPPATPEFVLTVWKQLHQELSQDIVALYTAVGGFANDTYYDQHMWSLWSLEKIVKENTRDSPRGVLFSDFLIFSHFFALRYEAPDRSSVWIDHGTVDETTRVASSIHHFLQLYLHDPDKLLLL